MAIWSVVFGGWGGEAGGEFLASWLWLFEGFVTSLWLRFPFQRPLRRPRVILYILPDIVSAVFFSSIVQFLHLATSSNFDLVNDPRYLKTSEIYILTVYILTVYSMIVYSGSATGPIANWPQEFEKILDN